jgi:hypothetical protein
MTEESNQSYGLSANIFVSRKVSGDTVIVGGLAADSSRWTRVLSQRAAQMLWFHLAKLLYPDKSEKIRALIATAPLRDSTRPTITTHMTVDKLANGEYGITGWINGQSWEAQFESPEAQRFWSALDIALYPMGWQGHDGNSAPQSE